MPDTLLGLAVLIVAVLPGAGYTWALERHVGRWGLGLADRTLRFTATSIGFHCLFGWLEYLVYRYERLGWSTNHELLAGQFAAAWFVAVILVGMPALMGSLIGHWYDVQDNPDHDKWKLRPWVVRTVMGNMSAPRAWDTLFAGEVAAYVRVQTSNGKMLAGRFAQDSYAAGYPEAGDLYLEQAYTVQLDGSLGEPLLYGYYIPASEIAWLELISVGERDDA